MMHDWEHVQDMLRELGMPDLAERVAEHVRETDRQRRALAERVIEQLLQAGMHDLAEQVQQRMQHPGGPAPLPSRPDSPPRFRADVAPSRVAPGREQPRLVEGVPQRPPVDTPQDSMEPARRRIAELEHELSRARREMEAMRAKMEEHTRRLAKEHQMKLEALRDQQDRELEARAKKEAQQAEAAAREAEVRARREAQRAEMEAREAEKRARDEAARERGGEPRRDREPPSGDNPKPPIGDGG